MPRQDLSEADIGGLIAFLDWVSNVDNQGWPPRPILVSGATLPGSTFSDPQQPGKASDAAATTPLPPGARPTTSADNPIALGENVFRSANPACVACHSISPGVNLAGPSLAGVSARAEALLASPTYSGHAKDIGGYLRESITTPSAHRVPGDMYSANGVSFMPSTYGKDLTPEQLDSLVAYLSSLR
jgi:nitric oxide reductase subunit C